MKYRFFSTFCSLTAALLTLLQLPQICCGQCCVAEPEKEVSQQQCPHCVAQTRPEPCNPISGCCCSEAPVDVIPPVVVHRIIQDGLVVPLPQLDVHESGGAVPRVLVTSETHHARQSRLNVWLI